jgi:hypothetical protein
MTIYKRRLAIILSAASIWFLGAVWLAFNPEKIDVLARHAIFFIVLVFLCVASIYFLYFMAKRFPDFTLGLAVIAAYFALMVVDILASFVLNLNNVWMDRLGLLIPVLLPLGTVLLFWSGMKKSRRERGTK